MHDPWSQRPIRGRKKSAQRSEATRSGYIDIAYRKTATASSIAHGGDPSRAVDGNKTGSWGAGSVTHTNQETNPWWQVALAGPRPISSVTISNRTDCCTERLAGAILEAA